MGGDLVPGETRDLKVRWLGDATSLERSAKRAASAVGDSGKKITGAGSAIGSTFGKLGKVLGTFHLPFAKSAQTVQGEMGAMETAGVSMGEGIAGAATAGLAVAGGAALTFGKQAVDAAEEFNKAHERLSVVVENVGESMKTEGGEIQGADKKLEALGFTGTDTEGALAKLVPVTGSVEKATKLLGLAADIARARNMSLSDATDLLVQVEAGRMKGLGKLIGTTKDAAGHTLTAAEAVVKLNDAFGGAASQYADTYAGHLATLHSEFDSLKVSIGNQIIPELSTFAGTLAEGLNGLNAATDKIHISIGRVVADVLSLGLNEIAKKGLSEIEKNANPAAEAMKNLDKAQKAYADDLARGSATSAQGVKDRKALTAADAEAKKINDGLAAAATTSTAAQQAQTAATKAAAKASQEHTKALQTEHDAILGVRDANVALDNAQLGVADSLDTYNQKALIAQAAGGKNAAANRDWERASNDVKSAIDGVASSAQQAADQQDDLSGKAHSVAHETEAQRVALEKLRDTIAPGNPFRSYLDQLIVQLSVASQPRTLTIHGSIPVAKFDPATHIPTSASSFLFAEGGTVPGPIGVPHAAIVHGGEVVTRAQDVGKGGGSTNTYSITVNVAPGGDPAATGKAVVDAIRAYERRNGRSWRGAA